MATEITVDVVVATARLDLVVAPGAPGATPPGEALSWAAVQSPQRLRSALDAVSDAARAEFGDDHVEIRSLVFTDVAGGIVDAAAEVATTGSVSLAASGYVGGLRWLRHGLEDPVRAYVREVLGAAAATVAVIGTRVEVGDATASEVAAPAGRRPLERWEVQLTWGLGLAFAAVLVLLLVLIL